MYEPKGEYQIVCEHLEPQGLGALQLAFEQLKKRLQQEGSSTRRASGRCRRCRARSASSRPWTAPRSATSSRSSAAAIRNLHLVIGPRACRARTRRSRSPAVSRQSAACPASTSSSSGAAADPSRIWGVQRGGRRPGDRSGAGAGHLGGRARNRRDDCRLRRRRARADAVGGAPKSSSRPRTSSAPGSIGWRRACEGSAHGRVQRLAAGGSAAMRTARVPGRPARRFTGSPHVK